MLTEKQKKFVNEYLKDLNATRAYKSAYPTCKKDETANVNGSKLLRNTKVAEYLEKRMRKRSERTEITQDNVLKELASIAFAKVTDFVTVENGCVMIKDTSEIPEALLPAIESIKEGKNGIEIKFHDKNKSLEMLGRHLGMFNDKVQVSGTLNNPMEGLTTEELKKLIGDD